MLNLKENIQRFKGEWQQMFFLKKNMNGKDQKYIIYYPLNLHSGQ